MSERDKFEAQKQKLENLCNEHKLTYSLQLESYPVTMTLRPLQGMYEQLNMLGMDTAEDRISQDAFLTFYSRDGDYGTKTFGTFTISEALLAKFRNIFKKLDNFWKHYFFREAIETGALRKGMMPVIEEEQAEPDADPAEAAEDGAEDEGPADATPDDELIEQATQLVRMENTCTASLLQRRLKLGYSKSLHLIDMLEQRGIVGPFRGSEPREVLPFDLPEDMEG